ncbi:hypothetical protein ESB00_09675 [Oleiharenicola lentus]|uniref:Uncharacterized protein n=2 Tax=Oleiharenicola lentus TaxID=2508720 RepID=A0A4Q1CB04_9BACT|nr:hypothetical protein ESB00_09675 [Oleiharenicola lentus]
MLVVTTAALLVFGLFTAFTKVRESNRLKGMLPRQPSAALDQFYIENPDRIMIHYDDIVGPDRYVKAFPHVEGADIAFQFPIRRHWGSPLTVRLPDGTTVRRHEVLAVVDSGGLIVTEPRPQQETGGYDDARVYQLETGLRYRGRRVTTRPPDSAGREGRDQDGIHTYQLPEGRRFEIAFRGGVPDGLFKAYYENGSLWGEGTYRQGRIAEAWVVTRSGRRFDELRDSAAATRAMEADAKVEAEKFRQSGARKLVTRDYTGAAAEFGFAIDRFGSIAAYLGRAEARLALGDRDGAIQDCKAGQQSEGTDAERARAELMLADLLSR